MSKLFKKYDPTGILTVLTFLLYNVWFWNFLLYAESLWVMLFFATLYYFKKNSRYYIPLLMMLFLSKNYIPLLIIFPMWYYSKTWKHMITPTIILLAFLPFHLMISRALVASPPYFQMLKYILFGTGQIISLFFFFALKKEQFELILYNLITLPFILIGMVGEGRYVIFLSLMTFYIVHASFKNLKKSSLPTILSNHSYNSSCKYSVFWMLFLQPDKNIETNRKKSNLF